MKVTSSKSVQFPKFQWGITKGEERDLPDNKKAQEVILAHPAINPVKEVKGKKD